MRDLHFATLRAKCYLLAKQFYKETYNKYVLINDKDITIQVDSPEKVKAFITNATFPDLILEVTRVGNEKDGYQYQLAGYSLVAWAPVEDKGLVSLNEQANTNVEGKL